MRIYKYLFREVVGLQLVITALLLFVFVSTRLTQRLFAVGDGSITPQLAVAAIFYRIPSFAIEIIPAAFMIAVMLTLSRLYADNEITSMHSCGFSKKRLFIGVMIPASVSACFLAWLTIWAAPQAMIAGNESYSELRRNALADLIQPGAFRNIDQSGSTVYADSKHNGALQSLILIQQSDDGLRVITAEQGQVEMLGFADYLAMNNGNQAEFTEQSIALSTFDQQSLLVNEHSAVVGNYFRELSTSYIIEHMGSGLDDGWTAKLFWRFHFPLIMLVIPLFAIPLSKANNRTGSYARIIPAVVIYMVYTTMLSYFSRELIDIHIYFALGWPHLIVAILCFAPSLMMSIKRRVLP